MLSEQVTPRGSGDRARKGRDGGDGDGDGGQQQVRRGSEGRGPEEDRR